MYRKIERLDEIESCSPPPPDAADPTGTFDLYSLQDWYILYSSLHSPFVSVNHS